MLYFGIDQYGSLCFQGLNEVIIRLVDLIMLTAPYAVFALLASVVSSTEDSAILAALARYAGVVVLGLLVALGFSRLVDVARWVLERRYGQRVSVVRVSSLRRAELDRFDVVVLPSGDYGEALGKSTLSRLRTWIRSGGTLVALAEATEELVHGLCQGFQKVALPRALMTDNGAAMQAEEFHAGLSALSILHEPTLPYSPYQNAKQETFWATVEGRLMAMLEGVAELTLEHLNAITQAWVEQEYHQHLHSEIGTTPLRRFLEVTSVGRDCPDSQALRRAFRCTTTRQQRRSDGTISLEGKRFEVPARYRHLERPMVRYARWDLRAVELIDPRALTPLSPLYPLNKTANANGQRRALQPTQTDPEPTQSDELPPLLRKCLADYAATGRPPAYLPHPASEKDT